MTSVNKTSQSTQPWIESRGFDCAFILAPAIIATVGVVFLSAKIGGPLSEIPLWAWVVFIMCIDVSHVYSTLYRTYFDPEERARYQALLWGIPLACWIGGVLLYSLGATFFWSALAYVAAFHFVRQQYGFTMIYARKEKHFGARAILVDKAAIYAATLYPLVYWHAHLPRRFNWFVDGDFLFVVPAILEQTAFFVYLAILSVFGVRELYRGLSSGVWNIPKNLFVWGTVAAWYVGIVAFNADVPFTITNVVSHGIPYIGLIWLFGRRKWKAREDAGATLPLVAKLHRVRLLPVFILVLLGLAYFEEGIWDRLVWRDHPQIFGWLDMLPHLTAAPVLALLVPLLAVPQATHYVLDAFIWKMRKPDPGFAELLQARGGAI